MTTRRGRDGPRIAQVGNFHPDVSHQGAEKVPAEHQVKQICWILSPCGYWGGCAAEIEEIHYEIFEPHCPVPSGSRFQTARGEDGNTTPLYTPPWIEYISENSEWELMEGEEWGSRPARVGGDSDERYLKRRNYSGNLALVQRVTDAPKLVAAVAEVEDYLVNRYSEEIVTKWKEDILHVCGWFPS
jgi:hypothetical protein